MLRRLAKTGFKSGLFSMRTHVFSDSYLLFLDFLSNFFYCRFPPLHLTLVKAGKIFPEREAD